MTEKICFFCCFLFVFLLLLFLFFCCFFASGQTDQCCFFLFAVLIDGLINLLLISLVSVSEINFQAFTRIQEFYSQILGPANGIQRCFT